jgi:hypothetical protein
MQNPPICPFIVHTGGDPQYYRNSPEAQRFPFR